MSFANIKDKESAFIKCILLKILFQGTSQDTPEMKRQKVISTLSNVKNAIVDMSKDLEAKNIQVCKHSQLIMKSCIISNILFKVGYVS